MQSRMKLFLQMNAPPNVKVIECTNAAIWKGADDLIYVRNKGGVYIDIDTHKETFSHIRKICKNQQHGLIVDMTGIDGISKESRDYSGSITHSSYVYGVALMTSGASSMSLIISKFFMGLNKPKHFPVQLFTDLNKAKSWLQKIGGQQVRA
jgi:hypothetical protein